jgi:hypothetical protein
MNKNVKQLFLESRKSLLVISLLLCILSLTACQLAREYSEWERPKEDMFIGFFITLGHLNVYNNPSGRIYAERDEFTFTFPGVEGIPFFVGTVEEERGDESVRGSSTIIFSDIGPGIVSDRIHVHTSDDVVSRTLSGTLNVNPRLMNHVYAFNPVFQTSDGKIYIGSGGSSVSAAHEGWRDEGRIQSLRMEESRTVTENGVSHTESTSVELWIAAMHPPERIVILQMDADHNIIYRSEYLPNEVPDALTPLPEAAYLIVETHRNGAANPPIIRALYGKSDGAVETFYERENGVVNRRFTQVEW